MLYNTKRGFTLIELLVVVIIIAVLAAIAVPQYKRAVLKSRFSTVMPMAKSIADAQEVYYQGRQLYALNTEELDVTPVTAENTSVALSTQAEEDQYAYVAAQRSDVPGARYIIYQKYSPKFASTIQCEADIENEDALWLCEKGLNGTEIPGGGVNTTPGKTYKTFLLEGNAGEDSFAQSEGENAGDESGNSGGLDEETLAKLQAQVDNCPSNFTCFINETNGTVTRCSSAGKIEEGECVPTRAGYAYRNEYNADGQKVETYWCNSMTSDTCTQYQGYFTNYNPDGSGAVTQRICDGGVIPTKEGICPNGEYADISGRNFDGTVDSHGYYTAFNSCVASSIGSDGKCGAYSQMKKYDISYDANGDFTGQVEHKCTSIKPNSTECLAWN